MSKLREYYSQTKRAAAVLTPEAMQAQQSAMPPQGGIPMDPSMGGGVSTQGMPPQGGMPMDPSMMGGMTPQGGMPMDPSMGGGMPPQGALPPEILQDQQFLMFLQQAMGITVDPNSGTFMDPNGQPIDPNLIMQAYQAYMQEMAMMQQQGGMPMDPSMGGGMPPQGMPPQGGIPMDPSMMGGSPMDPAMTPPQGPDIASTVESLFKEHTANLDRKLSALLDKIEALSSTIDSLITSRDREINRDEEEAALIAELEQELSHPAPVQPVQMGIPAPMEPKQAFIRPISIMEIIQGGF